MERGHKNSFKRFWKCAANLIMPTLPDQPEGSRIIWASTKKALTYQIVSRKSPEIANLFKLKC